MFFTGEPNNNEDKPQTKTTFTNCCWYLKVVGLSLWLYNLNLQQKSQSWNSCLVKETLEFYGNYERKPAHFQLEITKKYLTLKQNEVRIVNN